MMTYTCVACGFFHGTPSPAGMSRPCPGCGRRNYMTQSPAFNSKEERASLARYCQLRADEFAAMATKWREPAAPYPRGPPDVGEVEVVGFDGEVHYRRPSTDPDGLLYLSLFDPGRTLRPAFRPDAVTHGFALLESVTMGASKP